MACWKQRFTKHPVSTAGRALQIARPTDASQAGQGVFAFDSGPLPLAGSYTVVAEWSEHRLGVPLTSARSPATSITVSPGAPTDARVWSTCISQRLRNFPRLCCWLTCGLVLPTAFFPVAHCSSKISRCLRLRVMVPHLRGPRVGSCGGLLVVAYCPQVGLVPACVAAPLRVTQSAACRCPSATSPSRRWRSATAQR